MVKSILQRNKSCYICGTTNNLHNHHVFFGRNRKLSDKDGCTVWLCAEHHTGASGVHLNRKVDLILKAKCQKVWQEHYNKTKEQFIERYGKSYI